MKSSLFTSVIKCISLFDQNSNPISEIYSSSHLRETFIRHILGIALSAKDEVDKCKEDIVPVNSEHKEITPVKNRLNKRKKMLW